MGFNKRWVSRQQLIDRYNENGIDGIKKYVGNVDAFVMEDEISEEVIDVLQSKYCDTRKWDKIERIIENELREV